MDLVTLVAVCAFALRAALVVPSGDGDACNRVAPSGAHAGRSAVDRWIPYMEAASRRFGVPQRWLREVMRIESGGMAFVTSEAGAMGLMQLMPQTYAELSARYALGDDPYDPRANIAAGAAYLREMFDRFGAPGAFAAYNAGPRRVEDYVLRGRSLPEETQRYVALLMNGPHGVISAHDLPVLALEDGAAAADGASTGGSGAAPQLPPVRRPESGNAQLGVNEAARSSALFVPLPSASDAARVRPVGPAARALGAVGRLDTGRGGGLFVPLGGAETAIGK